ncbi:hypothetical protein BTJ68_14852 [Hortaea werneckii EXF-2000]|uniref:Uncharacterized protein n=1 Tax=Hortaea werneckii EXF-2000 TaxID=1157616 RepID=A0A1Z5SPS9_HORWE|nr:hypothetical protein BTJ68_14852 [Hortaea werneckii EXF-2000]
MSAAAASSLPRTPSRRNQPQAANYSASSSGARPPSANPVDHHSTPRRRCITPPLRILVASPDRSHSRPRHTATVREPARGGAKRLRAGQCRTARRLLPPQ